MTATARVGGRGESAFLIIFSKYSENWRSEAQGTLCWRNHMARPRESSSSSSATQQTLREARERFIALWGQMASNWGIPRTMAEVHGLLFINNKPMNTDEVMQTLGISRGNASMTLRALQEWGIISRAHIRGDRKEYFQAEQDVWKLFRTILRERKKREIDPLLEALRACRDLTSEQSSTSSRKIGPEAATVQAHNERLDSMLDFIEMIDNISQRLIASGKGLELAAKILSKAS
jgi:DNA-binding transcriptional regulator GbsR (MarR family)